MPPHWLQTLALFYVPLSIASALFVAADIFCLGRRHPMAIMDVVWPLTALYWGPLGLTSYFWFGRAGKAGQPQGPANVAGDVQRRDAIAGPAARSATSSAIGSPSRPPSPCSARCSRASCCSPSRSLICSASSFSIFRWRRCATSGLRDGVIAAIKIDTLSLLAYEVGMFAWMAVQLLGCFPTLEPTQPEPIGCMMQIAMICGFATTYPVNWALIAKGVKEKM